MMGTMTMTMTMATMTTMRMMMMTTMKVTMMMMKMCLFVALQRMPSLLSRPAAWKSNVCALHGRSCALCGTAVVCRSEQFW